MVDHFHAVRLANQALDEVRRRTQQSSLGHRGRRHDPLYRARRRLLTSHERLSPPAWDRLAALLDAGDPAGEVGAAYLARELLREVYATTSVAEARRRLDRFDRHCRSSEVTELTRLANTVRRWEGPILAWHTTGLTNGPTEAVIIRSISMAVADVGDGAVRFGRGRVLWSASQASPMWPAA